jgi:hypothetical protein
MTMPTAVQIAAPMAPSGLWWMQNSLIAAGLADTASCRYRPRDDGAHDLVGFSPEQLIYLPILAEKQVYRLKADAVIGGCTHGIPGNLEGPPTICLFADPVSSLVAWWLRAYRPKLDLGAFLTTDRFQREPGHAGDGLIERLGFDHPADYLEFHTAGWLLHERTLWVRYEDREHRLGDVMDAIGRFIGVTFDAHDLADVARSGEQANADRHEARVRAQRAYHPRWEGMPFHAPPDPSLSLDASTAAFLGEVARDLLTLFGDAAARWPQGRPAISDDDRAGAAAAILRRQSWRLISLYGAGILQRLGTGARCAIA